MSLANGLEKLKELPAPAMPSLWPQTWGWWALATAILLLGGTGWVLWKRRRNASVYRREAVSELDVILATWHLDPDNLRPLRNIPELLRRAVLTRVGRDMSGAAVMTGSDWQHFLTRMASTPLSDGFVDHLSTLAYAPDQTLKTLDLLSLISECRHWLLTHHDPV